MAKDSPVSSLDKIDFCSLKDPEGIFELVQMVGSGSYGQVFKGVHVKSGQLTAIKVINTMRADQEELKSEMNLLKTQSHHRNIVTFYGAFIKKGTPVLGDQLWLVMEFCGGGSVSDLIHSRNEKCVNEDWTAYISGEILKGLAHLHKYKIIHRDIKGQNVLLTQKADVKLVDFGVSAQLDNTLCKNTFIGTPHWMAPEVINCQENPDGAYNCKSDVWSLGITALEMAEGKPPLSDMHPLKAMLMVAQSERLILNLGKWSQNFQSFIKGCLVKDHTQRPSANDLLEHAFISNIQKVIRGIRHEIEAHMNKQKEEKNQAEKRREAQPKEKDSVQAGSPPRHGVLGPQMPKQEEEESLRRRQQERDYTKSEMRRQYKILQQKHQHQQQHQQHQQQQHHQHQQQQHSPGFYQHDLIYDNLNFPHEHKIHPPSPNLQKSKVAYPSKVKRCYSAQPQKQHQHSRSPSSPIPVPQICVSPQDEFTRKLRHKSPDSAKCNLRNYNSWNANSANEYKRRSASHSPCRTGERDTCRDENGNSLRKGMLRMSSSQECLMNSGRIDLASSAPECSLRQMTGTRERRLYSASGGNFLGVPQHHVLPSMNYLEEKENNNRGRRYSSQNDMDSIWPDAPQKIKHGIVNSMKALVRNMGLSPRASPHHSPASSRSASPSSNSPTPSSPYGSPFSPSVEWPDRFS
ncbi:traf2 and NCK-interacting protein kinase isoform X2 [Ictalurus punctatus]|uniref:Traf2 and NCK-interacting protein kinase isoform X2 n=1 Tax=Ictalurus punctatus TaxID=7998 RepID=A0A9F7RMW8_ICTPU|nr:traf2 and NCK-interacting protein kinase isoform X2 [Ictalurus punctatus]